MILSQMLTIYGDGGIWWYSWRHVIPHMTTCLLIILMMSFLHNISQFWKLQTSPEGWMLGMTFHVKITKTFSQVITNLYICWATRVTSFLDGSQTATDSSVVISILPPNISTHRETASTHRTNSNQVNFSWISIIWRENYHVRIWNFTLSDMKRDTQTK